MYYKIKLVNKVIHLQGKDCQYIFVTATSEAVEESRATTQAISYIPYGEVFVEQQAGRWSSPYLFNAKELDSETGLYYYGARYLDPSDAMWLSVDPLWEKYVGMTPYQYCMGNPVKLVDPDGKYETYYNVDGEAIGQGTNADSKARVVITNKKEAKNIKKANKNGEQIELQQTNSAYQLPSDAVLDEALNVLDRTIANGGASEESSIVRTNGQIIRGSSGEAVNENSNIARTSLPDYDFSSSEVAASIHSHPTVVFDLNTNNPKFWSADIAGPEDPVVFSQYNCNIIVGKGGDLTTIYRPNTVPQVIDGYSDNRKHGLGFYGQGTKSGSSPELWLSYNAVKKILNSHP